MYHFFSNDGSSSRPIMKARWIRHKKKDFVPKIRRCERKTIQIFTKLVVVVIFSYLFFYFVYKKTPLCATLFFLASDFFLTVFWSPKDGLLRKSPSVTLSAWCNKVGAIALCLETDFCYHLFWNKVPCFRAAEKGSYSTGERVQLLYADTPKPFHEFFFFFCETVLSFLNFLTLVAV